MATDLFYDLLSISFVDISIKLEILVIQ
jgi:hypothetical protein